GDFGHSDFVYNLKNTLNASLGPCLDPANPCAPGPDSTLGTPDDPGIPNQTSFFAGRLTREELTTGINAAKSLTLGLHSPVNGAPGLAQIHFHKVVTNVISGNFVDVGVFDVNDPAAKLLGAKPLKEEKSVNLSGGIAITPRDNLTITADVFQIKITDRILLGATFDDSLTLAILDSAGFTGIGGVQYFTNGLDTRTRGLD